jgi:hypothetical protein
VKQWPRCREVRSFLYLALLVVGCAAIGFVVRVQVLQVGDGGPVFRLAEGEVFSLCYIQSMYGVPVTEKLRVEKGHLLLFHVISSDAALEYFGIERKEENNVRRALVEFSIPRASVGQHALTIRDREMRLGGLSREGEHIRIRIAQMPIIVYIATHVWR